jgi:hypothetical protein
MKDLSHSSKRLSEFQVLKPFLCVWYYYFMLPSEVGETIYLQEASIRLTADFSAKTGQAR